MEHVRDVEGGTLIEVYVKPNSRRARIEGFDEGRLVVSITSPPREGRANDELIKLLRKTLRAKVEIVAGSKGRVKTLKIHNLSAEEVKEILGKEVRGRM
ncbi:MAG: YggU family protein [Desulfurococcales archaeon]|nr:YggU family protein [Desulfurococcales archaeon]